MLVVALVVQLVLGAGLVVVAVNGFPIIGGGGGDDARAPLAAQAVPAATANRFDAPRAMALIRTELSYGQRPAGSAALRRLAEVLRRRLPNGRFEALPESDPAHPLRNIVGTLPGPGPAILVGAHYDTEWHPKGFVGANDGAAGSAAVVELARDLRATTGREVRFVLFDGEEDPPGCTNADFDHCALRGSRAYVAAHSGQVGQMVLLDYIANKGVRLPREGTSNRALWGRVRAAATSVGVGAVFPNTKQTAIWDDHTPFLRARIPAVDLIDFSYRYADGVHDTFDRLSVRSLDAVGETVAALVKELRTTGG